jgi:GntR family transcriptional regulator, transcriptional repressor for pyruvate dehydrogenase complex
VNELVKSIKGIKAIKHHTVTDQVILQLKELILQGSLLPGDKMPSELEMCTAFSVGRTTIREALKVLEAMGFVERSRRGTFVTASGNGTAALSNYDEIINKARLSDLFEARRALEVEIVALAAQKAGEEDLETLEGIINNMMAYSDNIPLFMENDAKFHTYLGEACGNQVLGYLVTELYDLLMEVVGEAITKNHHTADRAINSHKKILKAIKNGSPVEARQMMLEHLDEIYECIK